MIFDISEVKVIAAKAHTGKVVHSNSGEITRSENDVESLFLSDD
jgi:hypothetical protein